MLCGSHARARGDAADVSFSGVIEVFTIIVKYVVKHLLCLYGRRVGVEADGFEVAVDGVLPVAALSVGVATRVIVVGGDADAIVCVCMQLLDGFCLHVFNHFSLCHGVA